MQVIENGSRGASVTIAIAIGFAIANAIYCVYILGPFGILASLIGAYCCYMVMRVERSHAQQGNIYLSESGFTIEKHSRTQIPWSTVAEIRMHIVRYPTICQLIFKLADGAEYPEGYKAITENSLVSKHFFGSGVFCANIMGYKPSCAEIEAAFKAAHKNWKKVNKSQEVMLAAPTPAQST